MQLNIKQMEKICNLFLMSLNFYIYTYIYIYILCIIYIYFFVFQLRVMYTGMIAILIQLKTDFHNMRS